MEKKKRLTVKGVAIIGELLGSNVPAYLFYLFILIYNLKHLSRKEIHPSICLYEVGLLRQQVKRENPDMSLLNDVFQPLLVSPCHKG